MTRREYAMAVRQGQLHWAIVRQHGFSALRVVCLAVILSGLLPARSGARDLETFVVGNWGGLAYADEVTGEYSHCGIYASYRSDISLYFLLSESGLSVGLSHPDWQLQDHQSYTFTLSVDRRWRESVTGKVVDDDFIRADLGQRSAVIDALKRGYVLTVYARNETFEFNLTGTARAIDRLQECHRLHSGLAARNRTRMANPFGGTANPFASPSPSRPHESPRAGTGRSRRSLRDFQQAVEFATDGTGIVAEAPDELAGASYIFAVGDVVFGTYWEIESSRQQEDQLDGAIAWLQSDCGGKFASARLRNETVGRRHVSEGFVACDADSVSSYWGIAIVDDGVIAQVYVSVGLGDDKDLIQTVSSRFPDFELQR